MKMLPVLQIVNSIAAAFHDRQASLPLSLPVVEVADRLPRVIDCDNTLLELLKTLSEFPAEKWLALCEAIEPDAILAAAVTWCAGFELAHLAKLISHLPESVLPLDYAYCASWFINHSAIRNNAGKAIQTAEELSALQVDIKTTTFLLSAFSGLLLPLENGQLKNLHPAFASIFAYQWACHGLPTGCRALLEHWLSDRDKPLSCKFWVLFALVLRVFAYQGKATALHKLAYDDISKNIAFQVQQAKEAGPLEWQDVQELMDHLESGSIAAWRQRFIRLAMWLPDAASHMALLVEASAPWPMFNKQIVTLQKHIRHLLSANVSLVPEVWRQKQEAKVRRKLNALSPAEAARQMQARGWTEEMVKEALAQTAHAIITEDEEGAEPAFVHFHLQTGAGVVTAQDKSLFLHFGRPDYVYQPTGESQPIQRKLPLPAKIYEDCDWMLVPLRHERVKVWRPVEARRLDKNKFCIIPMQTQHKDERWGYGTMAYVGGEYRCYLGGEYLTAVNWQKTDRW